MTRVLAVAFVFVFVLAGVLQAQAPTPSLSAETKQAWITIKGNLSATEGYFGEVPIIHQAVAVKVAIDALDAAFQETGDPN